MENNRMSLRSIQAFLLLTYVSVLSASLYAQSGISGISPNEIERAGQAGWQFLKINGDARQAAMGGAFSALTPGDAGAIFGNPAALAGIAGFDVQMNALKWVADIGYQSVAIAASIGDVGVVGASLAMLNYGDIPETINQSTGGGSTTPVNAGSSVRSRKESTEAAPDRVRTPVLPSVTAALYAKLPSTAPFSETVTTVSCKDMLRR